MSRAKRRIASRFPSRFPISEATKSLLLEEFRKADTELMAARDELQYREARYAIAQRHYEVTREEYQKFPAGAKAVELFDSTSPEERLISAIRGRQTGRPHGGFRHQLRELPVGERLFREGYRTGNGGIPEAREGLKLRSSYDASKQGRWYWWEQR